jgi:zinc transporter 9
VLEDAVALLGILLTLLVAGVSFVAGPRPEFDAIVAITVGVMLGVMALFLAAINRRLLIDTADTDLDRASAEFLAARGVSADVSSIVLDADHSIVFVRVKPGHAAGRDPAESYALGQALKAHIGTKHGKTIDAVYWKFPPV